MTEERRPYHEWQLDKARVMASRSRDPSTQCGAVIIRPDKTTAGEGYNGFPRRMQDKPEWYADRAEKYPRTIHAEMNALLHSYERLDECHMYLTGPACDECAKHIAAAGIAAVFWPRQEEQNNIRDRWSEAMAKAIQTFADCYVEVYEVEGESLYPIVQIRPTRGEPFDSMALDEGIGMT